MCEGENGYQLVTFWRDEAGRLKRAALQRGLRIRLGLRFWVTALVLLGSPHAAHAHLMPEHQGTVHLVGKLAYVVISLPMSAFPGLDDNGDGKSATAELQRHAADVRQRFESGLQLQDVGLQTHGVAQWKEFLLLPPAQEDGKDSYFLALGVAEFAQAPSRFSMSGTLLASTNAGSDTLKITATRSSPGQADVVDVGFLSNTHPTFTFFAPAPAVVLRFAQWGLEHILRGADHLVFLVALLAGGMTVRRWAVLLTAFTLAHGITFALASLGWIGAPARLVEPLIALSIVGVAGLNLAGVRMRLRGEAALVVGVGLVHGLGFASAMGGQGISTMHPVWSVLGFNAGVEVGQLLVAAVLFTATTIVRRQLGMLQANRLAVALSVISLAMGIYWLVERILGS